MKLFQSVRNFYQSIGIDLLQSNQKSSFNIKNVALLLCMAQMFISAFCAFLFEVKSIPEYGIAFYASITGLAMTIFFTLMISNTSNISQLIGGFEAYIENRVKKFDSEYNDSIAKIEQMSQFMYLTLVRLTSVGIVMPAIVVTLYNYFVANLGDRSYYLAYPMMLPLDWKTPFGYLIASLFQTADVTTALCCSTPLFAYFIGSCWLCILFVRDVSNDLISLDFGNASNGNDGNDKKNNHQMKERFVSTVQFYIEVKQFIDDLNKIYEFIITGYFLWSLSSISSSCLVLMLQLSEHNLNPIVMITSVCLAFWAFTLIYLYCELGERVAHEFNVFHEKLCQCDWHLFPIEMQRMYLIFTIDTQQPAIIRGYANTVCTREAFKKTTKAGFSYFMMLRQVDG